MLVRGGHHFVDRLTDELPSVFVSSRFECQVRFGFERRVDLRMQVKTKYYYYI